MSNFPASREILKKRSVSEVESAISKALSELFETEINVNIDGIDYSKSQPHHASATATIVFEQPDPMDDGFDPID